MNLKNFINVIKEAVLNVREVDIQYKLTSSNELMNLYTYQASEFLSLGVYVDINLSKISESKTDINVEVRRKIGSFISLMKLRRRTNILKNY